MDKNQMNEQANLAFEFIDKLYFEISYLIKEIEGLLKQEDEDFVIGRTRGYAITAGSSTGLDSPDWWCYKKFSVFYVPRELVKPLGGRTNTSLENPKGLKIIYLMFNLTDKELSSPKISLGILYDVSRISKDYNKKFEDSTGYYLKSIWNMARNYPNFANGEFEDKSLKFKGRFITKDLFDINNTEDIKKMLIEPVLKQFRSL
ncbi:MAG: hypothetical protein WBF08_00945 [Candidatus Bathyarchaeia archaeon]